MKSEKWYIAGPMSGYPQFNFPAFDEAAKWLRSKGYDIVSPAELDNSEIRLRAMASFDGQPSPALPTWGAMLARDIQIVADQCTGIILLPGWTASRGAKLEAYVGLLCNLSFALYMPTPPPMLMSVNAASVREFL